eukprot:m.78843 g.78843  ORF g.78843 m.78843 type:complete len:160 (+) comp25158_c0_seq6:493-972(+)
MYSRTCGLLNTLLVAVPGSHHTDGVMIDKVTKRPSTTTFLLYLNTVEDGGRTAFLAGGKWGWGQHQPIMHNDEDAAADDDEDENEDGGDDERVNECQKSTTNTPKACMNHNLNNTPTPVQVVSEVAPVRGSILVFPHNQAHEGTPVWDEAKWLLRGDMY